MLTVISALGGWASADQQMARGVVYEDLNENQRLDDGDRPLAGIRVSNGLEIVDTNAQGQYEIQVDDDSIIFVIKPKGYRTLLSEDRLPRFYYIHKPAGSPRLKFPGVPPTGALPKSINFPLYRQEEPEKFQALLFGDPQPRNVTEIDYMNRDVIPELVGSTAAFGVTLGDIVFDDLSIFETHNRSVAMIGIPWYNVLGNHDIDFASPDRRYSNETFERLYGPSHYSFDYGNVHFVVLDNINWHQPENQPPKYDGTFGPRQLEFLKKDLAKIAANQFVVLLMHIPLHDCTDAQSLYRLIESRPMCFSVSAHRHIHEHRFLDKQDGWRGKKPHHHIVNVTVSGSWWSGQKDERGIPHTMMSDGAPNGYSILTFDGNRYALDFKAASKPADYQLKIMLPEEVSIDEIPDTTIWVNVFNGSEKSTVEMRWSREMPWVRLNKTNQVDPQYQALFDHEQQVTPKIEPALAKPVPSPHLWSAPLPPNLNLGIHLIEVRTTDMHGRNYLGHRVLRVK